MSSRRKFITRSAGAIAGALAASKSQASEIHAQPCVTDVASLCGHWLFRTDPDDRGVKNNWQAGSASGEDWRTVTVPHTWQIETPLTAYRGVAWYWRTFDLPRMTAVNGGQEHTVRVEFEAVFHSATVWVNGKLAGEHLRKGYTAFTLDITNLLRWDLGNTIAVRVDNAFNQHMVPRGQSSDWANDGGIYRPVQLLITPKNLWNAWMLTPCPIYPADKGNSRSPRTSETEARQPGAAKLPSVSCKAEKRNLSPF
jgi:beta-galactosidase/beta-glucuronidase